MLRSLRSSHLSWSLASWKRIEREGQKKRKRGSERERNDEVGPSTSQDVLCLVPSLLKGA